MGRFLGHLVAHCWEIYDEFFLTNKLILDNNLLGSLQALFWLQTCLLDESAKFKECVKELFLNCLIKTRARICLFRKENFDRDISSNLI